MSPQQHHIDPQKRISKPLNRARLTLEARRAVLPLVIVAIGIAVLIGGLDYIRGHIGADVGNGARQTVRFATHDANSIKAGRSEVRFKGIPAGTITDVSYEHGEAVLTASFLTKFGPVYRNVQAEIRPNTPLNDMYLNIADPGTRSAGLLGDAIVPPSQTATGVQISSVLDTFGPDVRARLTTLLAQLGSGLHDHGARLREAFVALAPFIDVVGRLSQQLQVHAAETRRLVHNVGQLSRVLAARDTQLRALVDHGSRVLAVTGAQRAALSATLEQLPPTLRQLGSSMSAVGGVLPPLDQAVTRLGPVADRLGSGLRALRSISTEARPALQRLPRPLSQLVPLAVSLKPLAQGLSGAVEKLAPQMPPLQKITGDLAGCPLGPYIFFQWNPSMLKFEDAMGAYPVGDFGFAADTIPGVLDPGDSTGPSCVPIPAKGTP